MLKQSVRYFLSTCGELAKNWHSLAIMGALYLFLLAALYGFITTREATAIQVLQTLLFAAVIPFIFFLLQAVIIGQAREGQIRWYAALRRSCRLALVALPVIAGSLLLLWLTYRWQSQLSIPFVPFQGLRPTNRWSLITLSSVRTMLVAVVLPLLLIHVWLEAADKDLTTAVRSGVNGWPQWLKHTLLRALAPESVLLYVLGLLLFAAIPYVLLFVHLPFQSQWSEFGIFAARLLLAAFASLFGWVATLSAFTRLHKQTEELSALAD